MMDMDFKKRFSELWARYFNQAELPIVFFYSEENEATELVKAGSANRCIIKALQEVREGRSMRFNNAAVGCPGGKKYLGFSDHLVPNFEYFLSCGIAGRMEGERYKKSPEMVKEIMRQWPSFKAPTAYITFKRWDKLEAADQPAVVVFFAQPDVLSGLFTLANFDESRPEGVFTPMSSGCAAIVSYPYQEKNSPHPRAVIGMFDPSARPAVKKDQLSFALPLSRLVSLVANIPESFLTTSTWKEIQARI
jgi:uncharacterized protein (DUF169 family)